MKPKTDYYVGFEGEPEIVLVRSSSNKKIALRLWAGFLDNILMSIPAGPDGWSGLLEEYHLDKCWYEESPWKVQDIGDALETLKSAKPEALDEKTLEVWNDVCCFIAEAQSSGDELYIEYS